MHILLPHHETRAHIADPDLSRGVGAALSYNENSYVSRFLSQAVIVTVLELVGRAPGGRRRASPIHRLQRRLAEVRH